MPVVGSYEAKTHLPRLLDEVSRGATYTITKHGKQVARLVPIEAQPLRGQDLIDASKALRAGFRLDGLSVRDLIDEGRP
jgi:prevent-host-death family protein